MRSISLLSVILILWSVSVDSALAQTRRSSGRHRSDPQTAVVKPAETEKTEAGPWTLTASVGSLQGSDLFRAQTTEGVSVPWRSLTAGGFNSSRYTATLENNASFGLGLTRRLSPTSRLRLDLGYCRQDIAAEALVGQSGAVLLYDRMRTLALGLGAEWDLAAVPSPPYIGFGAQLLNLDASWADLGQTVLGGYLAGGFRQRLGELVAAHLEVRLIRTGYDLEGFTPESLQYTPPNVEVESQTHLTYFEIRLGIRKKL